MWLKASIVIGLLSLQNATVIRSIVLDEESSSTSSTGSTGPSIETMSTQASWTTTNSIPVDDLGCGCNYSALWLDVMLVVDSSTPMTQSGLQSLMSFVATALLQPTIGQGPGQKTRVGIITYSDTATLRYPMTAFENSDDFLDAVFNVPFENAQGSNIEAGIHVAVDEFAKNGNGDYSNRKKVIIVAASHYEPGGSDDPSQTANIFKGNGGFLITIEYVQTHGAPVPVLDTLASPCAKLSNINQTLHADQLLEIFCRANCFCSTNWEAYSIDQQCKTPDQGCYWPITIPAAWPLAKRYCAQQNGATLSTICESGKAIFMTSLLKNRNEAQWTGLYRQANGTFTWDDGTDYNDCQPSQNPSWKNGQPAQPGQPVAQISPSGFQNQFFGADPSSDYLYTCQNKPCSSTFYCP